MQKEIRILIENTVTGHKRILEGDGILAAIITDDETKTISISLCDGSFTNESAAAGLINLLNDSLTHAPLPARVEILAKMLKWAETLNVDRTVTPMKM